MISINFDTFETGIRLLENKNQYDSISNSPVSVCWEITSRCNEKCEFCFRDLRNKASDRNRYMEIFKKILESNVKKVTFSGGEPLLIDDLPDLLEVAKLSGLITSITTNGILLKQKWDQIKKFTDWVTLPIDGGNINIQDSMTRGTGHLANVVSLVNMIKNDNVSVKINTVISSINKNDLIHIAELINKLQVQRWKIFQFLPLRGYAISNRAKFEISDEEFHKVIKDVMPLLENKSLEWITIADRDYLNNNYFTILQEGTVRASVNNKDIIIGNVLEQDISEIWMSPYFDHAKHFYHRKWLWNKEFICE